MSLQDSKILAAYTVMRMLDMNYQPLGKALLNLAEAGPSPFVRHGCMFLGTADRQSMLPM